MRIDRSSFPCWPLALAGCSNTWLVGASVGLGCCCELLRRSLWRLLPTWWYDDYYRLIGIDYYPWCCDEPGLRHFFRREAESRSGWSGLDPERQQPSFKLFEVTAAQLPQDEQWHSPIVAASARASWRAAGYAMTAVSSNRRYLRLTTGRTDPALQQPGQGPALHHWP